MQRFVLSALVLVFLVVPDLVKARTFSVCPSSSATAQYVDHLRISDVLFMPEKIHAGEPVKVMVTFMPDQDIRAPLSAIVSLKIAGVQVFGTVVEDFCAAIAEKVMPCPLIKGVARTFTYSFDIPAALPKNVEMDLRMSVFSHATQLSCIDIQMFSATAESSGLGNAAPVLGEKNLRFMFTKWLEQFHGIAEGVSEWFPLKEEDKLQKVMFEERFSVFSKNLVDILAHNVLYHEGKVGFTKKMNQFGHLTPQEFKSTYLSGYRRHNNNSKKKQAKSESAVSVVDMVKSFFSSIRLIPSSPAADIAGSVVVHDDFPAELDWVTKGAVTPVKNQGSCGSCWAFSAIAAIEGAYFIKYGELKEFSEQELVSCEEDCYGCQGGLMDDAFNWMREHGGVCTEQDYPYLSGDSGRDGICKVGTGCNPESKTTVSQIINVDHSEDAVKAAVVQQPVSIAIEADQNSFQFYANGVLTTECGDNDDHGVTIVGYGNLNGVDYWKVKNSWGQSWGMEGYVLIQRGKQVPNGDGECGLLIDPVYPVLV